MRFFLLCLPLVFLIAPAHAQKVDEDYIEGLEIGCGFGLTEMCDELIEIEEAGKSVSLTLCNRTDERVRVAIANEVGEVRERRYRARGWRVLLPGECHPFWEWPLKDAALHVPLIPLIHAENESGRGWGGTDAMLCTPDDDFDITGDHTGDCDKRGYVEVDLIAGGWHRKGRTLDLTP